MGVRIVVVEDDEVIAVAVTDRLRAEGFEVDRVATGRRAIDTAPGASLVILDLGLPDLDGFEVCRRLRASGNTPILMLTARDHEADKVLGLTLGADDYLTKPFGMRELVARVRALLRRATPAETITSVGALTVDLSRRRVSVRQEAVELTATEFDLLAALAEAPGAVKTRHQLQAQVWGFDDGAGLRTIDSHVRALRRKLGADAIRTVHGVGYSLEELA